MALKKQSIRQGVHVLINNKLATKEELITLSESWTEKKEVFFRKMLQQGGKFRMDGKEFVIKIREKTGTYFGEDDIVRIEDDYNRE